MYSVLFTLCALALVSAAGIGAFLVVKGRAK